MDEFNVGDRVRNVNSGYSFLTPESLGTVVWVPERAESNVLQVTWDDQDRKPYGAKGWNSFYDEIEKV